MKLLCDSWCFIYQDKIKEVLCISWESTPDGITFMKAFIQPIVCPFSWEGVILLPNSSGVYRSFDELEQRTGIFSLPKSLQRDIESNMK